jgi:hypothetical protein
MPVLTDYEQRQKRELGERSRYRKALNEAGAEGIWRELVRSTMCLQLDESPLETALYQKCLTAIPAKRREAVLREVERELVAEGILADQPRHVVAELALC